MHCLKTKKTHKTLNSAMLQKVHMNDKNYDSWDK